MKRGKAGLDPSVPHGDATYDVIGAAMRVHSRLGPGLRERHYQRDLIAELRNTGRAVAEEHFLELWDGDAWLGRLYVDVLVDGVVVVECKRILSPKVLDGWQSKVGRFLWRPESAGPMPAISPDAALRVVRPGDAAADK